MLLVNIYFMLQILQKLDGMSNQINKLNNTGCNRIMPDNLKITHVYISSVDCVCSYHLSISMQFHNMGASTDAPLQYPPWCCARSSPPFNQKTAKHTLWYAQIRNTRDEIFTSMLQLQIAMPHFLSLDYLLSTEGFSSNNAVKSSWIIFVTGAPGCRGHRTHRSRPADHLIPGRVLHCEKSGQRG